MKSLSDKLVDFIVQNYDTGVFEWRFYPITNMWELNTEDAAAAAGVFQDFTYILDGNLENMSSTLDIHSYYRNGKFVIYIQETDETTA